MGSEIKYNLSYILTTRNRLPFLKITLGRLLNNLQPGDEVVVVDGNSTDGTVEYLQKLFDEGKIHQFITEPDRNQAHAWNKAMLMARGIIIKKIIDDDVFCYNAINECKNYMLQHADVDVVISNDLNSSLDNYRHVQKNSRLPHFEKWRSGAAPSFTFSDVHMLVRKSALSFLGLYNTAFVMMDWEYSLRISHLRANIVYYTGYNALTVGHLQTVTSLKNEQFVEEQSKRACAFYEYEGDRAGISLYSKIKIAAGKVLKVGRKAKDNVSVPAGNDIAAVYSFYYDYIQDINQPGGFVFLN